MDAFARYGFDVWTMDRRRLRQVRARRRQFRHRQRCRGSQGGNGGDRARNRAGAVQFPRRIVRCPARGGVRHRGARACRPLDTGGAVPTPAVGSPNAGKARRAGGVLPHRQHPAARPRHDREHLHARQAWHHRSRSAQGAGGCRVVYGDEVPTGTYLDMTAHLPVVDPTKIVSPVLVVRGEFDGIATMEDLSGNSFVSCRTATGRSRSSQVRRTRCQRARAATRSGMWRRHS